MKILMVCLGNICRSPLAEGIMRNLISDRNLPWEVDSAGTIDWHEGDPPDARAILCAQEIGIDISQQLSRKIKRQDLQDFDLIITMDAQNFQDVAKLDPDLTKEKLYMIMNFLHPGKNLPVPDPYYGGKKEFKQVAKMLTEATKAMIDHFQLKSHS